MSRQWLVRRSRFPLDIPGAPLGVVVARDYETAWQVARCRYKGFTVEPLPKVIVRESPAEAKRVERRKPRVGSTLFGRGGVTRRHTTGES